MESDEKLYMETRKGSQMAFRRLYEKYEKPIFSFIHRKLANRQDAEEVFHETMLAIFKGPESFASDKAFTGWLFKVALNKTLNRLRSKQRASTALVALNHESGIREDSQDQDFDQKELQKLADSVLRLNKPLKQLYNLRSEGKSYEEISAITGAPVGTIKSRINKMVKELRKEMSKWNAK